MLKKRSKSRATKAKPRKASSAKAPPKLSPMPPLPPPTLHLPPDAVLVPVPIEKTKTSMWQQFVDWLSKD